MSRQHRHHAGRGHKTKASIAYKNAWKRPEGTLVPDRMRTGRSKANRLR